VDWLGGLGAPSNCPSHLPLLSLGATWTQSDVLVTRWFCFHPHKEETNYDMWG
jgi:hypothetical protein